MNQVALSKKMSLALRHAPERFGLTPDTAGWVPIPDFLAALQITRTDLDTVVANSDKQRFEGHVFYRSMNGVWLTESVPPNFLSILNH